MAGSIFLFSTRFIGLLLVLLLGVITRVFGQPAIIEKPDDIGLTITFLTEDGAVCAHEPLLARLEFVNNTEKTVNIPSQSCLEICDGDGNIVAAIPRPKFQGGLMAGGRGLKPGEKYRKIWIISALHQFDKPGSYTLHVHFLRLQTVETNIEYVDLVSGQAEIRALPFDEARVTAQCEKLYQPQYNRQISDIEIGIRARALYSDRHELALPYLDWMAREWRDVKACYAIRQIGTPRATALLEALGKRQDDTGKAARTAMTMTHTLSMWDVGE